MKFDNFPNIGSASFSKELLEFLIQKFPENKLPVLCEHTILAWNYHGYWGCKTKSNNPLWNPFIKPKYIIYE